MRDQPLTIELVGHVDGAGVDGVQRWIDQAIEDEHVDLLVDLAAVTLIDASLLDVLVAGQRVCHRRGGSLQVIRPGAAGHGPPRTLTEDLLDLVDTFDFSDAGVGEQPIEVRVNHAGATYSGFVKALRQRGDQREALVTYFVAVPGRPVPRRLDEWMPLGRLNRTT